MKNKNHLIYLYFFLSVFHIGTRLGFLAHFQLPSKALLMPVLAVWFLSNTTKSLGSSRNMLGIALVFSFLGDVLLGLVSQLGEHFFLLGLVCFFMTHLLYILVFWNFSSEKRGLLQQNKTLAIPFFLFFIAINTYLHTSLNPVLQIAVPLYSLAIIVMVLASLNLHHRLPQPLSRILFLGALSFMISDLILAINAFKEPVAFAPVWIMITYLGGQYLIIKGCLGVLRG